MSTLGLVGGIPTAIGMVVAWPIARKLGKKRAVVTGLCFSVVGGLVCFLNVTQLRTGCHQYGVERNRKYSGNVCDDGTSFRCA